MKYLPFFTQHNITTCENHEKKKNTDQILFQIRQILYCLKKEILNSISLKNEIRAKIHIWNMPILHLPHREYFYYEINQQIVKKYFKNCQI